jgi:hypothetical protein
MSRPNNLRTEYRMPRWSDEIRNKVLALSATKTVRQIAEEVGVSKSSVGLFLKDSKNQTVDGIEILNAADKIEMIDDKDASAFLKSLGEGQKEEKPTTALVESLLADIPIAEHIPRPFKTRGKAAAVVKEKVVKEKVVKEKVVDDPEKKAELIGKITFNVNTFENLLGDVIRGDKNGFLAKLDKMSQGGLEIMLKTVETTRSVKNISNQLFHFFTMGASVVEIGTAQYLGMKTQGFTQVLLQTQEEELRLIMTEMAMEQKDKLQKIQRPEVRLAMIMTTTLMAVNTQNSLAAMSRKQGQPKPPSGSISEDKAKDYKDL